MHAAAQPQATRVSRLAQVICAIGCLLLVLSGCSPAETPPQTFDPPVVQGVAQSIVMDEGDDLMVTLMEGVSAVGGADRPDARFQVTVTIYDMAGAIVSECPPGDYRVVYSCEDENGTRAEAETMLTVQAVDDIAPVIEGAADIETTVGGTVSYREGITVTDNVDASVQLQIDSSAVNLAETGLYPVVYSATDKAGNRTEITIMVIVNEAPPADEPAQPVLPAVPDVVTQEMINDLCDKILNKITNDSMSLRDKAYAVYKYVYRNIKYVGSSDKSDWLKGAYVGFVHGRGDCFNYFACSKALLTRLDIPTVDVQRVGGTTRHYWQLANLGQGWYHFDACWHPAGYPLESFMLTEAEVRAYTEKVSAVRKNYFVYDYDNCPVIAVGTPEDEAEARRNKWAGIETPADPETPVEGETPVTPETPAEGETPVTPETPAEGETPVTPETPAEGETPVTPETPAEGETPAEPETPTEGETPVTPETPAEGEAPAEPETPAESETPAEGDTPAAEGGM